MTRRNWLTKLTEQLGLSRNARFPIQRATLSKQATLRFEEFEDRVVPAVTALNITAITSTADTDGGTAKHVSVPGGATVQVDYTYSTNGSGGDVTLQIGSGPLASVNSGALLNNQTNKAASLFVLIPAGAALSTYDTVLTDNESGGGLTKVTVANSVDVVPQVIGVSSTTPNGAYTIGQVISIQVNFNASVVVTGSPVLFLNSSAGATYSGGSGTSVLTFLYTVKAGQNAQDLDYTSTTALSLNGGTIVDTAGQNASLTLPNPGGAGSLGANKNIIIDTIAPTVDISPPIPSITAGGPVSYTVKYSDLNFSTSTLTTNEISLIKTGTANATGISLQGSGSSYTVSLLNITGDGTLGIVIAAGTAIDAAGNVAGSGGPSATFQVDNTAPTVNISPPTESITSGGPVSYTVSYPDDVDHNTIKLLPNTITLNSSGTANATVAVMSTADPRSFIVSLVGITGDGSLGISIAPGTATDYAGNPAAAAGPSATFEVDNTPLAVSISTPSVPITAGGPVSFIIDYAHPNLASITLSPADITVNKTGTADATVVTVSGTGDTRLVTLSGITGDGTLGISIAAGTATDTVGNTALPAGPSNTFEVDNTPLAVNISGPSVPVTASGPVTYIIDYTHPNFASSSLSVADITLNKTGTANGVISVDAGTGPIRTVTISGITGDGTLGISIAAGTAIDSVGNLAVAAGPSATVAVQNTVPAVIISPPSASIAAGGPVTYTITYPPPFTASTLTAADVTLNRTGTANGTVSVDAGTGLVRTVTISGITGNGTLGISLAAGTANDGAGGLAPAAGPSTTFQVDNTPLAVVISSPSVPITAGGPVTYTITYPDANFASSSLKAADITLNKTGTANGIVSVAPGSGRVRTVTISGITGNGSLGISIAAGTAVDSVGNVAVAAGPSTTFQVDNSLLSVVISPPSAPITAGGPITYTVTYPEAHFVSSTLSVADITLNTTGTANGTVSVSPGSGRVRTVTISNTTGNGTLGISIAAGTATDSVGNVAGPAGPSTTFEVDNMPLLVNISAPSEPITQGGPVTYTINYPDADFTSSTLSVADITLNKTGTANGTVSVDAGSGATRTVTISNISGNGTLGISIAAGTATDSVGNVAGPAGPSTTFEVSNIALFAVGNSGGTVRIVNANTGGTISTVRPLDSTVGPYTGLVEVALGDFNGDGIADLAVSAADPLGLHGLVASKAGKVFVYDGAVLGAGTLNLIHTFTPFATTDGPGGTKGAYTNGLNIAAGDVNGDGHVDLIAGTRGVTADVGTPEYGRLVVISEGAASDGSGDMILGGFITPFGATYQKGVVVAAGNLDGVGGEEIGVTRGGPVAASNPNKSIKLKAFKFTGGALEELDLSGSAQPLAPFPAIERDGRVAFVDPNGDGKQQLVFSALDRTDPTNTQVRIAVFDVNTSTGLATPVSTGTGPSQSYTVGNNIRDHAITYVDLSEDGSSDLALITESSAAGALSNVMYLAPLTGATLPGGFSISLTTGGVAIDGV